MTDAHRLTEVRRPSRTYHVAHCICGHTERHNDRATAVALVYKHVIDSARPACPTPSKSKYGTEFEARNAIANFLRRPGMGPRPIRPYKCPSGQHWHTTKQYIPERRAA